MTPGPFAPSNRRSAQSFAGRGGPVGLPIGTGSLRVHNVGSQELRREVANRKRRHTLLTGFVTGEELIRADGGSGSRLIFCTDSSTANLTPLVLVVPFSGGHAAPTSRMVRDVR